MNYFEKNLDHVRKLLMREPRGHQGMFGAILTESADSHADIGVFFITHSGYLNMCVHSAIGAATACLDTGIILKPQQGIPVNLETPAGIVSLVPNYEEGSLKSMTLQSSAIFVHTEEADLDIGLETPVKVSLVFSAVFFVLLDVKQFGMKVNRENIPELTQFAVKALKTANETFEVRHPHKSDINTIDLAMLYEDIDDHHAVNAVVSPSGCLDRSPCGAGTGAKTTYLHVLDKLNLNENYVNKSVFGTKFVGKVIKSVSVGAYKGANATVTGAAFITGFHDFILDEHDPIDTGIR